MAAPTVPTISADDLAARLAEGRPPTLLDVRDPERFAAWHVTDAPVRNVPAEQVLADPMGVAGDLGGGDVVVVCQAGVTAVEVTDALAGAGRAARVLEGGMTAWSRVLRALPVDLGADGLTVLQVQRVGRGCLSYVLVAGGEALVVDPVVDPAAYERLAGEHGARIGHVVDTHLHADHLSIARELARRTGGALRVSEALVARGIDWEAEATAMRDGDTLTLGGGVEIGVVALPGHTTDMTGLVVAGRALLSGDSLFADSVARPDLEVGDPGGARDMARRLHATLHERVLALGDDVILLPGHYGGGVLGAAVAPTLAQARAVQPELELDAGGFADAVLADMPPRPANYTQIIAANAGRADADPALEVGANNCAVKR